MHSSFIEEQADRCRRLAENADPFIKRRLLDLAAKDAPMKAIQKQNTDPKVVMMQTMQKTPRVGSNGGTAAGLVGSYDEVAARIGAFHAAGIELFMLQFQPFEAEMERFAREVIPRVRAAQPGSFADKLERPEGLQLGQR